MGKSSTRMACIYGLVDPLDPDNIRYIGRTVDLAVRLKSHVSTAKSGKWVTYKDNWIRSLLSRGSRPSIIQLTDWMHYEESGVFEINMIKEARMSGCLLTNTTDGGEGCVGLRFSEEARSKMSDTRKSLFASGVIKATVNRNKKSLSGSRYYGVRRQRSGTYRSTFKCSGFSVNAGVFESEIEAAMAYDMCARKHGVRDKWINFPEIADYPEFFTRVTKYKVSKVSCERKSLAGRGRKRTQSSIDKFRLTTTGRKMSPEAVVNMRKPLTEGSRRSVHVKMLVRASRRSSHGYIGVSTRNNRYRVVLKDRGSVIYQSRSFKLPFEAALHYDNFAVSSGRLWLPINFKEIL